MVAAANLVGVRFGRLVGVSRVKTEGGHALWTWACDCGNFKDILATSVKRGLTNSCGCLQSQKRTKHGHGRDGKKSRTYQAWLNMKARVDRHPAYTAKGVKIYKPWRESFARFLAYMGPVPDGLTLERKNNNGNYEPGNVRWATQADQLLNTSRTHRVILDGNQTCLLYACRNLGFSYRKAMTLLKSGLTAQDIIDGAIRKCYYHSG